MIKQYSVYNQQNSAYNKPCVNKQNTTYNKQNTFV